MGALSSKYVLENGDAAPFLVKLYFSIDLGILTVGFICWLRCLFAWRAAFNRVNCALQCYFWVFICDGITLINFFLMSSFGVALGRLPDGKACAVCAFVSMTLAYVYANAYLVGSAVALMIVLGVNEKSTRFRMWAWLAGGSGFIWGLIVSTAYGAAGMFGPYRHLYCMIPRQRYNQWGLILGFVFVAVEVVGALSITVVAAYLAYSVRQLSTEETSAKLRAFHAIQRTNIAMIVIYFIAQGIVLAVEIQIWLDGPIPVMVDAISGMFYKSQVIWDSLVIHRLLWRVVQRDAQSLGRAHRQVAKAHWWASQATVAPAPQEEMSDPGPHEHNNTIGSYGTSQQQSNHIAVSGRSEGIHSDSGYARNDIPVVVGARCSSTCMYWIMRLLRAVFPAAFVPLRDTYVNPQMATNQAAAGFRGYDFSNWRKWTKTRSPGKLWPAKVAEARGTQVRVDADDAGEGALAREVVDVIRGPIFSSVAPA